MNHNGNNEYEVTFGRIMFLQKILEVHENVSALSRHDDIVFEIERVDQRDSLQIICVDEYVFAEAMARRVIVDFPNAKVIFIGGKWNRPSPDAKAFCKKRKIAVCNAGDINQTLYKARYW